MRKEIQISAATLDDTALGELFNIIDIDGGGTITADELDELLKTEGSASTMTFGAFGAS